ncbi:MAG: glycosyltransferase family 2 protein [Pseudomonadota bacterium]
MLKIFFRTVRLRAKRRRLQIRALRRGRDLVPFKDQTQHIGPDDVLLFCTLRNEAVRLPFFLDYYRKLGVDHFILVDNGSDDGSVEFLSEQPDVSIWTTTASYKRARFGMDWINYLLGRKGVGHWCLTVDVDEFLVFPYSDVRPIRALTDWLDTSSIKAFGTMLLDMYSERPVGETLYRIGQNPFDELSWFDAGNYSIKVDKLYGNLWIQGGPRMRAYFAQNPAAAPALNKIPLVRWKSGYVYFSSTHSLLPRGLNRVFDEWGGEKTSGCLLHAKFLELLKDKSLEELERKQHYAASREYRAYLSGIESRTTLWNSASVKYTGWRQLEELGLMSTGGWI